MMKTKDYLDLNTNEIIHQIIYLVKHKNNYNLAASFFIENNLSSELLNKNTLQLSKLDITKLKDSITQRKNLKR